MAMKGGELTLETIKAAEDTGDYSQTDLSWMRSTRDSMAADDVRRHRGVETYMFQNHGHRSPTYAANCQVLHAFDLGQPLWGRGGFGGFGGGFVGGFNGGGW